MGEMLMERAALDGFRSRGGTAALRTSGLCKRWAPHLAVKAPHLPVRRGAIFGFLPLSQESPEEGSLRVTGNGERGME